MADGSVVVGTVVADVVAPGVVVFDLSLEVAGTSVVVTESPGLTTSSVPGSLFPVTATTVVAATKSIAATPPATRRRRERVAINPMA
ncbi:MAG: hypothetical protein M5U19_11405 [Microthrixaceae bacterium]|nr:hypothetical protein [Microthrixaceae bacterium]